MDPVVYNATNTHSFQKPFRTKCHPNSEFVQSYLWLSMRHHAWTEAVGLDPAAVRLQIGLDLVEVPL